jgi:arylsulfatase A-like enzyme
VPFIIRGPGIPVSSHFQGIAGNVDIAPTIMELAEAEIPSFMNGKSFAKQILQNRNISHSQETWRNMYMIEYWSLGNVTRMDHLVDGVNDTYLAARLLNSTHNYVYAEYYSDTTQLQFGEPVEYEFYDLNKDPWQMKNAYNTAEGSDKLLIMEMRNFIREEYGCKGRSCADRFI